MLINKLDTLPDNLPVPEDDGGADHLEGMALPPIGLLATDGTTVMLSELVGRTVVFIYPRTGRPGVPALSDDWNEIPGARGCTPQTCGYRDLYQQFVDAGCRVFGLSTQDTAYQDELVIRLGLPFPMLSDAQLELTTAMRLPTMEVAGLVLLKRMAWIIDDGRLTKVFYPVFPPDRNATEVLHWLRDEEG